MAHSLTGMAQEHDFSSTFTAEYDIDKTALTIITPTSGKLIKVTGVYVSTEGATAAGQKIRVYFGTSGDTIATIFPTTTPVSVPVKDVVIRGAVNEAVKITTDLGNEKNYYLAINYKEE